MPAVSVSPGRTSVSGTLISGSIAQWCGQLEMRRKISEKIRNQQTVLVEHVSHSSCALLWFSGVGQSQTVDRRCRVQWVSSNYFTIYTWVKTHSILCGGFSQGILWQGNYFFLHVARLQRIKIMGWRYSSDVQGITVYLRPRNLKTKWIL